MALSATLNRPVDLARIGPEDLWAVWSRVPAFLLASGAEKSPAFFSWMLASQGDAGLRELQAPQAFGDDFLLAMPLSRLQSLADALEPPKGPVLPGWVQAALGSPQAFRVVETPSGEIQLVLDQNQEVSGKVVAKASLQGFFDLLTEGQRIVSERDWKAIHGDRRPAGQTGLVKWLDYQQNPESSAALDRFLSARFD